jgi:hypothetical protein
MKTRRLRHLVLMCVSILVLNQSYFGIENKHPASPASASQNKLTWFPFVPEDEELTAMVPAPPAVLIRPSNYLIRKDGERVLASRVYSGYGNGLVFIIESYKAEKPQNLWGPLLENADKSAVFERDIAFDGITARQYRSVYSTSWARYTRHFVRFATKEHVYSLTLATLEETNPVADQFLSSLRLRGPADRVTPIEMWFALIEVGLGSVQSVTKSAPAIIARRKETSTSSPGMTRVHSISPLGSVTPTLRTPNVVCATV